MGNKRVFLTVGTTEFDLLIQTTVSHNICKILRQQGYTSLVMQIGRGQSELIDRPLSLDCPAVTSYRFKDSIDEDIAAADLIISHAGAGSVLETLVAGKALVVVINEDLMDNHQQELAEQLTKLHHLVFCTCRTLEETLLSADLHSLRPYVPGNPAMFVEHLDRMLATPCGKNFWRAPLCHVLWISVLAVLVILCPSLSVFLLTAVSLTLTWLLYGHLSAK